MGRSRLLSLFVFLSVGFVGLLASAQTETNEGGKQLKIFVLAGQSNMQGQGVVDLDHEEHYNGGRGTLAKLLENKGKARIMGHLRDANGSWTVRDDVWVRHQTKNELKKGKLTIGFTSYSGSHHIGPELQFGHVMGDLLDEPVLLVKTAWGGKSLGKDFLPPSMAKRAKVEVGPYYKKMMAEVQEAIEQIPNDFPELVDYPPVISGFVWQQGWNDMFDDDCRENYAENLAALIRDVRKEWGQPDLPVVVGELGNGGLDCNESMQKIRDAERQATRLDEFDGTVAFAPTAEFARPKERSPNVTHGHHWFGNAESYFLIGDALGNAMRSLITDQPRVLILGDSISMGYTPLVKKSLSGECYVTRPNTNCEGTTKGVAQIDRWLELEGGGWDVIHFNFGLHDLKRVNAETRKNSNNPDDPNQAPLDVYQSQLNSIVEKLKANGATLIFATTTPVPPGGVKPHRDLDGPQQYNQVAMKIMKANGIEVNDLFAFVEPQIDKIMRPVNVHFFPEGSAALGEEVVKKIRAALQQK